MASRVKDREYRDNFLRDFFVNLSEEQQVKLFKEFFYELEEGEMVSGLPDNQEEQDECIEEGYYGPMLNWLHWAHSGDPLVE